MRESFDSLFYPDKVIELINKNTDEKMVDHIRKANRDYLDTIAMKYMGVTITYRELFTHIDEYARALKQFGLRKGDYVTICLPNSPETVYYFYACNEIGVTPYLIDPRYTLGKMIICLKDSGSRLFICEMGTYFSKVALYEKQLPVDMVVVVSPLSSLDVSHRLSIKQNIIRCLYKAKTNSARRRAPASTKCCLHLDFIASGKKYTNSVSEEYDPNIPAIVVNTSGTSGTALKGAMHSNKSYNIFMNQIDLLFGQVERGDLYYGYIPFFSMYGSSTCLHAAMTKGAVLNLIPTFNGEKSIRELLKQKSNIFIGVPAMYEKLVEMCRAKKIDVSFAKLYVIGGDNMLPEKLEAENNALAALGMKHKITYGYGATEVMMISTTSDDERSHSYGSSGAMYPGTIIKIIDPETGAMQSYGQEGEIVIHTQTMMMGYLNKPEETDAVFTTIDGIRFFRTGDKGYVSETGHLFLTGRYKRLMKRPDGHQVSPIPIENAVGSHPLVADCCVVGIKKCADAPGVIPTAFLKPKAGTSLSATAIKSIANKALEQLSGEREIALAYCVVESIPYTENGKMDYRKLESRDFRDGTYYVVDDPITKDYFSTVDNVTWI